jgi:hypothetical protein
MMREQPETTQACFSLNAEAYRKLGELLFEGHVSHATAKHTRAKTARVMPRQNEPVVSAFALIAHRHGQHSAGRVDIARFIVLMRKRMIFA